MKQVFSLLFVLALATKAHAGEALFGAEGNERCGLGSKIFAAMGSGGSITSETTEESLDLFVLNESFSVTTGTSGCSHSGLVQIPRDAVIYANANYEELSIEMASGRGEVLNGLGQAFGCDVAVMPLFKKIGKEKYGEIYSAPNVGPNQMIYNFHQRLQQLPQLARGCRLLTT